MQRPTEWIEQHRTLRAIVAFPLVGVLAGSATVVAVVGGALLLGLDCGGDGDPFASSRPGGILLQGLWFAALLFAGYLEGFGAHLRGDSAGVVVAFGVLAAAAVLVASVIVFFVVGAANGCLA